MSGQIDETHDPALESWVESANDPGTEFPIQNLPVCIFRRANERDWDQRLGVVIGDRVLDIHILLRKHLEPLERSSIMAHNVTHLGDARTRRTLRVVLSRLLRKDNPAIRDDPAITELGVLPLHECIVEAPSPRGYTDFYASVHHATNVGSMFRPDNALLPNYKWVPIGYHGRASSIVASGAEITRPWGQLVDGVVGPESRPMHAPCKQLDYELEVGVVVGRGNKLGKTIPIERAEEHILGLCLLNDWSARDVQKWEYQPLGPFLAKNFATTVSPYIVTMEALAPFRSPRSARPTGDPAPLAYLDGEHDRERGAFDIKLEVFIQSAEMKKRGLPPQRVSQSDFKDMYWTPAQLVTHHASNGCNMESGDLLGSGTVSGPRRENRGCMLELTWDGDPWATPPVIKPGTARTPIELPSGEKRVFLEDGDEVIFKGFCERDGYRRIGFGKCRGTIKPARPTA